MRFCAPGAWTLAAAVLHAIDAPNSYAVPSSACRIDTRGDQCFPSVRLLLGTFAQLVLLNHNHLRDPIYYGRKKKKKKKKNEFGSCFWCPDVM